MDQTPTDSHAWPVDRLVAGMIDAQAGAIAAIRAAAPGLEAAISAMVPALEAGGRLIFMGAGTSGRLAAQDAAELPPTFDWPRERALVLIAGGLDALHTPVERAEDDATAGRAAMEGLEPGCHDIAIGVAASGTTPYTLAALKAAAQAGAVSVAICNRHGSPLAAAARYPVVLETGAEFVHGSTRLSAGTAQKIALNILTTAAMIRLGRVYRGHMVEMPPTNAKLESRAVDIVAEVAGCDADRARQALATGGSVKVAIVMAALGLDRDGAVARLDAGGGKLGRVLQP